MTCNHACLLDAHFLQPSCLLKDTYFKAVQLKHVMLHLCVMREDQNELS